MLFLLPYFSILISYAQSKEITYFNLTNTNRFLNKEITSGRYDKFQSFQTNSQFEADNYIGLTENTWKSDLSGDKITVAILDTGIDPNHDVFTNDDKNSWKRKIITFYDNRIDDESNHPYDIAWHGTWTASILGGNSRNYQGVAPKVNLIIMKIFEEENGQIFSDIDKLNKAVNWLLQNKEKYNIKIASMSFGVEYDEDYQEQINIINNIADKLMENNILVVASAGNYGNPSNDDEIGSVSAPGSAKSVLTVGGILNEDRMYQFSGSGPTHEGIIKPDTCAPAVNIYGAITSNTGDKYDSFSGTSASTPMVAGLAALMLEKRQNTTALDLKKIITCTSYKTVNPLTIKDNIQGYGIVQGYAALDALNEAFEFDKTTLLDFTLDSYKKVLCLPIKLTSNHYFFKLEEKGLADAEMYLFSTESDQYGNPILLSHSINQFSSNLNVKNMGFNSQELNEYYLIIKSIHNTGIGTFTLSVSFDIRLGIIFLLATGNSLSLIYILYIYLTQNLRRIHKN